VTKDPDSSNTIESHGPYQHGAGFPSVNGFTYYDAVDPMLPAPLTEGAAGLDAPNVYASEFGVVSWSSYESLAPTLSPQYHSFHGGQPADVCQNQSPENDCTGDNVLARRNYPCGWRRGSTRVEASASSRPSSAGDNLVGSYFGGDDWNRTEPPPGLDAYLNASGVFHKQLYQCLLASALYLKSYIEVRRSSNEIGHLVWQLNEIWPTGGWGSLEYGSVGNTPGQVVGGRWKPHHYWYLRSLYQDVMATCGEGGSCYVKNDRSHQRFDGAVEVDVLDFSAGTLTNLKTVNVSLAEGPAEIHRFSVPMTFDSESTLLVIRCVEDGKTVTEHEALFARPGDLVLPAAEVSVDVQDKKITLSANATALYVTLTTLAQGRFSDNVRTRARKRCLDARRGEHRASNTARRRSPSSPARRRPSPSRPSATTSTRRCWSRRSASSTSPSGRASFRLDNTI